MRYEGDLFDHHDDVLWFQISAAQQLPSAMGLTLKEFLELDEKYKFLFQLRIGYEIFHLTGIKGIADSFKRLIDEQAV